MSLWDSTVFLSLTLFSPTLVTNNSYDPIFYKSGIRSHATDHKPVVPTFEDPGQPADDLVLHDLAPVGRRPAVGGKFEREGVRHSGDGQCYKTFCRNFGLSESLNDATSFVRN